MDPLSDILQLLSVRSYITTGQSAGSCWAMRYPGFTGMKIISLRKGKLWFRLEHNHDWYELSPGDTVILTRSTPFIMATDPSLSPVHSESVPYIIRNGIADYGGDQNILLAGKMDIDQIKARELLKFLPIIISIQHDSASASKLIWLMDHIHAENLSSRPGSSLTSNHLMQLMMIEGIRSWLHSNKIDLNNWIGSIQDPRIQKAISAMHTEPHKNWQLSELADVAGMSRAGFARRFNISTRTTPLNYLTHIRMHIASQSLRLTSEPIKQIAFGLGYTAESTFSTVFKRIYGVSPTSYRASYCNGPLYSLNPYLTNKH